MVDLLSDALGGVGRSKGGGDDDGGGLPKRTNSIRELRGLFRGSTRGARQHLAHLALTVLHHLTRFLGGPLPPRLPGRIRWQLAFELEGAGLHRRRPPLSKALPALIRRRGAGRRSFEPEESGASTRPPRAFPFRKDSISDGVSRLPRNECAGFGLGEPVEPVASRTTEDIFDVAELGAELSEEGFPRMEPSIASASFACNNHPSLMPGQSKQRCIQYAANAEHCRPAPSMRAVLDVPRFFARGFVDGGQMVPGK